jgi:DNA-binding NtrC family response regulator
VLSDLEMAGLSGVALLERVRREHPGTEFVLVTGHASV